LLVKQWISDSRGRAAVGKSAACSSLSTTTTTVNSDPMRSVTDRAIALPLAHSLAGLLGRHNVATSSSSSDEMENW